MLEIITLLRSLSYGGLLGGGLAGLIYLMWPDTFPKSASLDSVVTIGGLIGAGCHRLINDLFLKVIFKPLGNFITYYSKLAQLILLRRFLNPSFQRELIRELTKKYFLD